MAPQGAIFLYSLHRPAAPDQPLLQLPGFVEIADSLAYQPSNGFPRTGFERIRTVMVKALQQWLEENGLFAIVAGVLAALIALAMLLVFGSYYVVTH